jgi:hypothetical protein
MMRIRPFYLTQLHNGEHVAFHEESLEQLSRANPARLGVIEQIEPYNNAIIDQQRSIDVFMASEKSAESAKLDKQRDREYSALKAYLKVYANDEDSALSEAAERILFVIRKSAIENGDPTYLGLTKETTAINSLLRNLESLHSEIELTGATNRLNKLATTNRLFEELQIERNVEKAGKHSGNVKAARVTTDAAYNTVVERINAQALLYGGDVFDSYIKEQNTLIDKYANLVAHRKGITKKTG